MTKTIIILFIIILFLKKQIQKNEITPINKVINIEDGHKYLFATTYTFSKIHRVMNDSNTLNGEFLTDIKSIKRAKGVIESGYGIEGKEQAIEALEWLINEGHRKVYEDLLNLLYEDDGQLRDIEKQTLIEIKKKYGDKSLIGWDLVRANHIALYTYMCGYLDESELVKYYTLSCNIIYSIFHSWKDLIENVALGHKFFTINVHGYNEENGNLIYKKHMDILNDSSIYQSVEWKLNKI